MRIVIIGAVAGGASAAARARRLSEQAEIVLVERGEAPSFANCGLPYYIGGVIEQRDKLILSPGAAPIRPSIPGVDLPQVYTLRELRDADRLHAAAKNAKRAVVIG